MSAKKIYRTARQEAIRKGLIAKIWTLAWRNGMDKDDLYTAIMGEKNRKGFKSITIYKTNMNDEADGGKRVSLSSLKIWQLKQVIAALFPEGKKEAAVVEIREKEKKKKQKQTAEIIEIEGLYKDREGNDGKGI